MLCLGNRIGVYDYIVNSDGCWVLLDESTKNKYCFNTEGDAWSLAMSHNNVMYLSVIGDKEGNPQMPNRIEEAPRNSNKRGFNFVQNLPEPHFSFGSPSVSQTPSSAPQSSYNPFVFGDGNRPDSPKHPRKDKSREAKLPNLSKWFRRDEGKR